MKMHILKIIVMMNLSYLNRKEQWTIEFYYLKMINIQNI